MCWHCWNLFPKAQAKGSQSYTQLNFLLMQNTSCLSYTSMEHKNTLCLFEVISKVICAGFVMVRAPENPSLVQDTA